MRRDGPSKTRKNRSVAGLAFGSSGADLAVNNATAAANRRKRQQPTKQQQKKKQQKQQQPQKKQQQQQQQKQQQQRLSCDNLRLLFNKFDANKDGGLCRKELRELLLSVGFNCSKDEAERMVETFSASGNGRIEFAEFRRVADSRAARNCRVGSRELFDAIDRDGDGRITPADLSATFADFGSDNLKVMFAYADVKRRGFLNFDEFERMRRRLEGDKQFRK